MRLSPSSTRLARRTLRCVARTPKPTGPSAGRRTETASTRSCALGSYCSKTNKEARGALIDTWDVTHEMRYEFHLSKASLMCFISRLTEGTWVAKNSTLTATFSVDRTQHVYPCAIFQSGIRQSPNLNLFVFICHVDVPSLVATPPEQVPG